MSGVDVERAEAQLNALVERRAEAAGRANAEEELWKASVRKHNARLRRQHRAEWFAYFSTLASSLRASADEFDRRAEQLLEEADR